MNSLAWPSLRRPRTFHIQVIPFMNSPRLSSAALAACALACSIPTASAQQVFLDQQPTQTFSLQCTLGVEANADNFVVPAGPGIAMNTIRIWGTWNGGSVLPDTFDVVFHGNDSSGPFGDVPGATTGSVSGVVPTVVGTGLMMPTQFGMLPEYELTLTLPAAVSFAPGTHWVELYSTNSSGSTNVFIWGMAGEDMTNGGSCMSWSTTTPGVMWNACTPFPETDMAIVLSNEDSSIGTNYCTAAANSTGSIGAMSATGSVVAAANDLTLMASSLPANQFGIFVTSMTQGFSPGANGTSNGNICLGGAVGRFTLPSQIVSSGMSGEFSLAVDLTQFPQGAGVIPVLSGQTWNFQAWHRDGVGLGSNFTDGLQIDFL